MAYFSVTYQLNKDKDYPALWDALENLGAHKVQRSHYFVDIDKNTVGLKAHLLQYIDEDDMIMVVRMHYKPDYNKALKGTNDWVNSRFS